MGMQLSVKNLNFPGDGKCVLQIRPEMSAGSGSLTHVNTSFWKWPRSLNSTGGVPGGPGSPSHPRPLIRELCPLLLFSLWHYMLCFSVM